jgi:hypothetical protein
MRVLQAFQPSHHQAMHFVHMPEQDLQPDKQQQPGPSLQLAEEEPGPSLQLAEEEPEPHLQLAEEGPVLGLPMHAYLVQLLQPEPPLDVVQVPERDLQPEEEQESVPPLQAKHQLQVGEEQDPVLALQPKHQLQVGEEQDPVLALQPKHQLQVGEEQTDGLHVLQIIHASRLEETSLQRLTSLNNKQSVKIVSVNQAKLALKYL